MQADPEDSTNGRSPSRETRGDRRSELDELRATCRRQAQTIDGLSERVGALRRGAEALKAENADLRAEISLAARAPRPVGSDDGAEHLDVRVTLDVHAPAGTRGAVAAWLGGRVAPRVLDDVLLVASELVTNSVRHSGVPAGAGVDVGVTLTPDGVRVDVEDPGRDGAVAPRAADTDGGGFGLNIVHAVSERWGVERAARGGTRVWAQLAAGG